MINLFFKGLAIVGGFSAIASVLIDMSFLIAGYHIHLDDLFLMYVVVFFVGFFGILLTNEK